MRSLIVLDHHPYPYEDNPGMFDACETLESWVHELPNASAAHKARLLKNDPQALVAALKPRQQVDVNILGKIDIPCLIVAARDSEDYANVKRCAEDIKDAEFVSLDGFEHLDILFRGSEILPHVVDFLSRVS